MAGVGYFGKIASLGDFVRRDTPPGFVEVWDPWLQSGLTESRAALGDAWLDHYAVAPIWRFALAPGLAGAAAVAGLVMSSQDRVGRLFPLTLMAVVAGTGALQDAPALVAMEEAALAALDPTLPRQTFDADIRALAAPRGDPGAPGSLWETHPLDAPPLRLAHPGLPPARAFACLLDLGRAREAAG